MFVLEISVVQFVTSQKRRPRQVSRKAGLRGMLQAVVDDPVQPMRPHRPLTSCQIAQQAAQCLMPLKDQVIVCAFEGNAVQTPYAQVVPSPGDHVMGADE